MDAVIRLITRLHDQRVLIRTTDCGVDEEVEDKSVVVEFTFTELDTVKLSSWDEILARIMLLVSLVSSLSFEYVSITKVDRTAENKPAC